MLKRILSILFFLFIALNINNAFAANKYASALGGNWSNDLTAWVTTSGGAIPATHPTAGDVAYLESTSGAITVDVASACDSLVCTGYTSTLTQGANLTVAGSITLVAGMTYTPSTYTLIMSATGTLTTGEKSLGAFTLSGAAQTITLGDDATVTGTFTWSDSNTLTSNDLYLQGNITGTSGKLLDGSCNITINGGANQTFTGNSGIIHTNLTINKSGNTLSYSGIWKYGGTGTLTYTAGTIDCSTGTSTLTLVGTAPTLATNGIDWYNVSTDASNTLTVTLSSNLTLTNTLTFNRGTGNDTVTFNGNQINAKGNITNTAQTVTAGTTVLQINGTGNQSFTGNGQNTTYFFGIHTEINKAVSGTLTMTSESCFSGIELEWIAGTVDATAFTVGLNAITGTAINMPASSITFSSIVFRPGSSQTININSNLICTGDIVNSTSGTITLNTTTTEKTISFGGNWTIGMNYNESGSGIHFIANGTGTQNISSAAAARILYGVFEINKASGTLNFTSIFQQRLLGDFIYTAGTVNSGTSNIALAGTVTSTGMSFYDVEIYTGLTTTLSSVIDINGDLAITGTLLASSYQINVGENFTRTGTFTHGNNTVVFDGSGTSIISGANTFYNLSCVTPSKALTFPASTTQTIANTLTLNGQANGTKIVLNSSDDTNKFTFDCTAPQAVSFVNVKNSQASTSDIVATKSKNSGNTDVLEASPHWIISGGGQVIMCE